MFFFLASYSYDTLHNCRIFSFWLLLAGMHQNSWPCKLLMQSRCESTYFQSQDDWLCQRSRQVDSSQDPTQLSRGLAFLAFDIQECYLIGHAIPRMLDERKGPHFPSVDNICLPILCKRWSLSFPSPPFCSFTSTSETTTIASIRANLPIASFFFARPPNYILLKKLLFTIFSLVSISHIIFFIIFC